MLSFLHFCQTYSGAIQAIAMVVLIGITSYYAVVTHRSLKVASLQLEASLLPQVAMELGERFSNAQACGVFFGAQLRILNGGVQPFTINTAAIRLYPDQNATTPVGNKELSEFKGNVVAGGTETAHPVLFTPNELTVNGGDIVAGNWRMEVLLQVYNALHTRLYKYIYDAEHGIRKLSE